MKIRSQRILWLALFAAFICGQAFALHQYVPSHHVRRTSKRRSHIRRILWNPVFRPSHESLLRQNEEIDRLELPRIQNQAELDQLVASEDLVPIVPSESLRIDPRLTPDRRYCRPWTRDFVEDLGSAYHTQFGGQIQVNSAVRTVLVQKKLRRHNRNAAPEKGDTASSHLAGITVDLQRRGMTRQQIQWVEQYLVPLRDAGLIEPEEERHQWVFHIAVSGRYADWRESQTSADDQRAEVQKSEPQVDESRPLQETFTGTEADQLQ